MDGMRTKKIAGQQTSIETEILQEIAEALGNAGVRIERALDRVQISVTRVEKLRERLAASKETTQRHTLQGRLKKEIARYNALRQEAVKHYRNLIIHREAVGFRNHKLMEEKYKIPAPLGMND
jgi:hypothetical protein